MEALQREITGKLQKGDELVVVGEIGLFGTALLAVKESGYLREFFSAGFLRESQSLVRNYGAWIPDISFGSDTEYDVIRKRLKDEHFRSAESSAWKKAVEAGASALFAVNESGITGALWKMAEASQVGFAADLRKIPIRQETVEICEKFDLNPYKLLSQGCLLVGIRGGEALVQEYRRNGISAAVIGQTNGENRRLLFSGENARYLERPSQDEICKMPWANTFSEPEASGGKEEWQD